MTRANRIASDQQSTNNRWPLEFTQKDTWYMHNALNWRLYLWFCDILSLLFSAFTISPYLSLTWPSLASPGMKSRQNCRFSAGYWSHWKVLTLFYKLFRATQCRIEDSLGFQQYFHWTGLKRSDPRKRNLAGRLHCSFSRSPIKIQKISSHLRQRIQT